MLLSAATWTMPTVCLWEWQFSVYIKRNLLFFSLLKTSQPTNRLPFFSPLFSFFFFSFLFLFLLFLFFLFPYSSIISPAKNICQAITVLFYTSQKCHLPWGRWGTWTQRTTSCGTTAFLPSQEHASMSPLFFAIRNTSVLTRSFS